MHPRQNAKDLGKSAGKKDPTENPPISQVEVDWLNRELARTGLTFDDIKGRYDIDGLQDMTIEIFMKAIRSLQVTPDADKVA